MIRRKSLSTVRAVLVTIALLLSIYEQHREARATSHADRPTAAAIH